MSLAQLQVGAQCDFVLFLVQGCVMEQVQSACTPSIILRLINDEQAKKLLVKLAISRV